MADFRTPGFWANLLKKIVAILLKSVGAKASPTTHHQHVVPHPDGWAVKGEGNEKFTGVYPYQDDAIDRAREIAENYGSDVIIHRADGSIRERRSYKKK
ncbi:MAG: DUF2188 domain-containing protein [Saprospirales bacterium]|nr:DUF2188 domain-containing protein [Saprospirales bacterium]